MKKSHRALYLLPWIAAAGIAVAQTQPAPMPRTPAPDVLPPPVVQPDAVRHAEGPEASRMRSDPFMDFNDPRVRSEMAECTRLPRDERSDCVRGLWSDRDDVEGPGPAEGMRERGVPLRDRDPGVSVPR